MPGFPVAPVFFFRLQRKHGGPGFCSVFPVDVAWLLFLRSYMQSANVRVVGFAGNTKKYTFVKILVMTYLVFEYSCRKVLLCACGGEICGCSWLGGDVPSSCGVSPGIPYHEDGCKEEPVSSADASVLEEAVGQLKEYFDGSRRSFELPVKLSGTRFQIKVWEELKKIGYGETVSYKELARRVGNEKGVRAVAQACGANPVGIVVPCHRVISSDGTPGGYAGGVDTKISLLRLESRNVLERNTSGLVFF